MAPLNGKAPLGNVSLALSEIALLVQETLSSANNTLIKRRTIYYQCSTKRM